jgi:hypothetical protein
MTSFIIAGCGFLILAILLAWYISGYGLKASQQFSIGFKAILISYLLGTVAMLVMITLN